MNTIKYLLSIIIWFLKVVLLLIINFVTIVFSPIICLFTRTAEENSVTGFPSQFPNKPRTFLIKPLFWFQSFDAPLDELFYGGYTQWPINHKKRWLFGGNTTITQEDYDSSKFLRYLCYVSWLCRNPAYGFGQALGYDSTGMTYLVQNDNTSLWNTGKSNASFWKCINSKGQIGWWYKAQFFFTSKRFLEINFGYKLDSDTVINKHVVAMQLTPFLSI